MRSSDCAAPGRWTSSEAVVRQRRRRDRSVRPAGGAALLPTARRLCPPDRPDGRACASPTAMSVANAGIASRIVKRDHVVDRQRGERRPRCRSAGGRRDARRRAAARTRGRRRADGMSRSCLRRLRRSSRTRSNSRASRRGRVARSASRSQAALGKALQRREPSSVASEPMSVSSGAEPAERLVQLERVRSPLPSSSMSPVIAASPGRSAGSAAAPPEGAAACQHSGTSRCSTVQTRRPLASTRRRMSGK